MPEIVDFKMKKPREKHFDETEFKKTYKTGEELVIFVTSPFSEITDPRGIKFWATHWNQIAAIGDITTGTAYAICERNLLEPIKIYGYYLSIDANHSGTIVEIKDPYLKYHHIKNIDEIPSFLKYYISKSY